MRYLTFDLEEVAEGVATLEAMVSTRAGQRAAVMTEVQEVLDWAWRRFPSSHGPVDDGLDWDHALQVIVEADGWHRVTLTLCASRRFVAEFTTEFGDAAA